MKAIFYTCIIVILAACTQKKDYTKEAAHKNISAEIFNEEKAIEFNKKFLLGIPYQEFRGVLMPQLSAIGVDIELEHGFDSYFIFADAFGNSVKTYGMGRDTTIKKGEFILWYQPLNFKKDRIIYFHNNELFERDLSFNLIAKYNAKEDFKNDLHCVEDIGDSYFYTADFFGNRKVVNGDSLSIVDFEIFKINKKSGEKEKLFWASEKVQDSMLIPDLFEYPGESPLYSSDVDIYHWNWIQINEDKMLVNYAFCGFQQIDLNTGKVDWHWGHKYHTFSQIEGEGDLSGPYYTHHLNKIKSGPYKGMYSYFENGSEPVSGKPYKPARARIIDINEESNTVKIIWEKVYDFASYAMGSIQVFDEYILVNMGFALPFKKMKDTYDENGPEAAKDFFSSLRRPMLYLYDAQGNPISEYTYEPGFYSYIASAIEKTH